MERTDQRVELLQGELDHVRVCLNLAEESGASPHGVPPALTNM